MVGSRAEAHCQRNPSPLPKTQRQRIRVAPFLAFGEGDTGESLEAEPTILDAWVVDGYPKNFLATDADVRHVEA